MMNGNGDRRWDSAGPGSPAELGLNYLVLDFQGLVRRGRMSPALTQMIEERLGAIQVANLSAGEDFDPSRSLCIADCRETADYARSRDMAILGYEPPGQRWENQAWLPTAVEDFDQVDAEFLLRVYQRHHHIPWTVLTTDRCRLREMTPEDADALYKLYEPEEITRYMEGLPEDKRSEEAYIRDYISHMYEFYGYGMWVVIHKHTGKLMGRGGLSHLEVEGEVQLELGYVIDRAYQRRGYGYEVCRAILDYAKEELNFKSIHCLIRKENLPSVRLAEKLGFVFDKAVLCNGKEMQRYSKILHFS